MKQLDSVGASVEYLCSRLDKLQMSEIADHIERVVSATFSFLCRPERSVLVRLALAGYGVCIVDTPPPPQSSVLNPVASAAYRRVVCHGLVWLFIIRRFAVPPPPRPSISLSRPTTKLPRWYSRLRRRSASEKSHGRRWRHRRCWCVPHYSTHGPASMRTQIEGKITWSLTFWESQGARDVMHASCDAGAAHAVAT